MDLVRSWGGFDGEECGLAERVSRVEGRIESVLDDILSAKDRIFEEGVRGGEKSWWNTYFRTLIMIWGGGTGICNESYVKLMYRELVEKYGFKPVEAAELVWLYNKLALFGYMSFSIR